MRCPHWVSAAGLTAMDVLTSEMLASFRDNGYLVVPEVLSADQVTRAREAIDSLLSRQPIPSGHAGPYFLWPKFGPDRDHPLLSLYRETVAPLAGQLLRSGL